MRILLLQKFRYWDKGHTLTVDNELGEQLVKDGIAILGGALSTEEKMFKFLAQNNGTFPAKKEEYSEEE